MARRKVEVRREEILAATVDEVQQRGFGSTRVADVAARARHQHRRWSSTTSSTKDALLADGVRVRRRARPGPARRGRRAATGTRDATRLRAVLRLYAPARVTAPGWTLWIDAWAAALRSPRCAGCRARLDVRWKDAVAEVIREGVGRGRVHAARTRAARPGASRRCSTGWRCRRPCTAACSPRAQLADWVAALAARELGVEPRVAAPELASAHLTPAS